MPVLGAFRPADMHRLNIDIGGAGDIAYGPDNAGPVSIGRRTEVPVARDDVQPSSH